MADEQDTTFNWISSYDLFKDIVFIQTFGYYQRNKLKMKKKIYKY